MGERAKGTAMMKQEAKMLVFNQNPVVYKCDPNKNVTCRKTACHNPCFYTLNPAYSADGKRYRLNDNTNEIEDLDARQ